MSLSRQGRHYIIIGALQYLLDWAVMVGLSHLGLNVEAANVCGRVSGALLGFRLNGKITFAADDTKVGRVQLQRYLLMWLCTTSVSTWGVGYVDSAMGLHWAWLAKPLMELILGAIGFFLSRHWIYKA